MIAGYNKTLQLLRYTFSPMYHPYTALFLRELKRNGLEGLLNRKIQLYPQTFYPGNSFGFGQYGPTASAVAADSTAHEIVDFDRQGAYSVYNWEAVLPRPVADRHPAQPEPAVRGGDALVPLHLRPDRTTDALPSPQRSGSPSRSTSRTPTTYRKQRIEQLAGRHRRDNTDAGATRGRTTRSSRTSSPGSARSRTRSNVVMKYIDNLIAWGDQLFRQDTIESINEATQLYVLADELLGAAAGAGAEHRRAPTSRTTSSTADGALDPFGNAQGRGARREPRRLARAGACAPTTAPNRCRCWRSATSASRRTTSCSSYWDTVADRLFKIRHCMNIDGVVRQLPLFEPPIDPALLVKAAAAGIDIGTRAVGRGRRWQPVPLRDPDPEGARLHRRRARPRRQAPRRVQNLDAETLSLLRSTQERTMLDAVVALKNDAIALADTDIAALAPRRRRSPRASTTTTRRASS